MDTLKKYCISLAEITAADEKLIGGKAFQLSRLSTSGYKIPRGFVITVNAYRDFVGFNRLQEKIAFELGRKRFADMRWEEMWDAALRIRSAFMAGEYPNDLKNAIINQAKSLDLSKKLVARSSSPKEDSASASFAGLHESIIGIKTVSDLLKAIKQVWASLWSDAALLYQRELGLNPMSSTMAVVVQELIQEPVSGVAFGLDPRNPESNQSLIEAVPGLCENLVDGSIDPDRWTLDNHSGKLINHRKGERVPYRELLDIADIRQIFAMVTNLENIFGWHADTEWTGTKNNFTLLQARPITTTEEENEEKAYYLTLRPGQKRLKDLARKVAGELIPELESLGNRMAAEPIEQLDDKTLSEKLLEWHQYLIDWKEIYKEYFIPFAHGVRHLAAFYNDEVQPEDPYEFVGLLKGQKMIAGDRNQKIVDLAKHLISTPGLKMELQTLLEESKKWDSIEVALGKTKVGRVFLANFNNLMTNYMDVSYKQERLSHQPLILLNNILEIANPGIIKQETAGKNTKMLEEKLFKAVGLEKIDEAKEILKIGRLSWQLRDDDNLLIGKVESQVLKALNLSVVKLKQENRLLTDTRIKINHAPLIAKALISTESIQLPRETADETKKMNSAQKPRQLVGQPAAAGLTSALARVIQTTADLGNFKAGEVLVCDAIQPNMTHLVPLASAIIERRGGMLIHGAIIAREMGIPCVNGVPGAAELIRNGDLVTVDGHLGIVTIGAPEFDLELENQP